MSEPTGFGGLCGGPGRLRGGVEVLERWSRSANQIERNALYKVLFSVLDGSVRLDHLVIDDMTRPEEFFVLARRDLVAKIGISGEINGDSDFDILYIGPLGAAPGLDDDRHFGADTYWAS